MATKKKKSRKENLSPEEIKKRREKRNHMNMVRTLLSNVGFVHVKNAAGVNFTYKNRPSELDDIFVCENIILIVEYTTERNPTDHLLKKSLIYDRINEDPSNFIQFLIEDYPNDVLKKYYNENIKKKYSSIDHLKIRILYCSRYEISEITRKTINGILYLDYNIALYFQSLTRAIKRSSIYEFLDFLKIENRDYADNILQSYTASHDTFKGYVLPESKTSLKQGYKVISFYMDAASLLRRAYVLRQESWRDNEGIDFYQRMLDLPKINNIRKYLHEEQRVFVNNIIATISADDITIKRQYFDENKKEEVISIVNINKDGTLENVSTSRAENILIEIRDKCNIIGIIDGQHRLYAYHEGNDAYEDTIRNLRKIQNLLVTCILYPKQESKFNRTQFEANLFLEINKNQKKLQSSQQQEIELIVSPFSTTAIGKEILKALNSNGPLENKLMQSQYDTNKISTASIVSFGLKPLIKLDENAPDSLFRIWDNPNKLKLKDSRCDDDMLRKQYVEFCVSIIRELLRAYKDHLSNEGKWQPYSATHKEGVLGVVLINGILNVLRILVSKGQLSVYEDYYTKLEGITDFSFRSYTSSQYRMMGVNMYKKYWG